MAPARSNRQEDPLAVIIRERGELRRICDDLEQIADQLGGPVDGRLCLSVLMRLRQDLPLYHRDEEVLYDLLRIDRLDDANLAKCIELALCEHRADESYALDLDEPLSNMGAGRRTHDAQVVGYMLRCSFEGMRRHLNWEDAAILDDRLSIVTGSNVERLSAGLTGNRSSAVCLRSVD